VGESQGATMPTLETVRLSLRPFETGDLESLTSFFADPDATCYLPRATVSPRERAQRMIKRVVEHWRRYDYGVWAAAAKLDGALVGYCGLNWVPEADAVEIDYGLLQAYWGRGIATEAARAAIGFGFEQIKLDQIIGLVVPENVASRCVLEHLGMTYMRDVHFWGLDLRCYEVERKAFQDQVVR
jgi:[ribosomal protein S5]-alanine N-acetyltransferase